MTKKQKLFWEVNPELKQKEDASSREIKASEEAQRKSQKVDTKEGK